jgi:tRNA nucleotidyltransferase (CCA-adding enzyme)
MKSHKNNGFFLVGGCIRDMLLGRTPKDWDMVTTEPYVVKGLYPMIGKDFPVWQVKLVNHVVELASARTERKIGDGHTGFECTETNDINQDLLRRDLTINAIALSDSGDIFYAPNALEDLKDGVLRHVTKAFAEDPLRVFRVARFAAQLGFTVHPHTTRFMFMLRHELKTLSPDRVRVELERALMAPHPSQFFRVLKEARCLDHWFPEVESLIGSEHSLKHHPEGDAFEHVMLCMETMRKNPSCTLDHMLAILGHDFGKGLTDPTMWPKHIGHEQGGIPLIINFCNRLGYGRQTIHQMTQVAANHMVMHKIQELRPSTLRKLLLDTRRSVLGIKGFGDVCQADHNGRGGFENYEYKSTQYLLDAMEALKAVKIVPGLTPTQIEQTQNITMKAWKNQYLKDPENVRGTCVEHKP